MFFGMQLFQPFESVVRNALNNIIAQQYFKFKTKEITTGFRVNIIVTKCYRNFYHKKLPHERVDHPATPPVTNNSTH